MEPLLPGLCDHIYNHANGNENLFRGPEDYRYFLQQHQKYISPFADTLAWCLMPNFINKYPALEWFGSIRLFKPFHEEYVKELRAR
jgi:hypothetical protein